MFGLFIFNFYMYYFFVMNSMLLIDINKCTTVTCKYVFALIIFKNCNLLIIMISFIGDYTIGIAFNFISISKLQLL